MNDRLDRPFWKAARIRFRDSCALQDAEVCDYWSGVLRTGLAEPAP